MPRNRHDVDRDDKVEEILVTAERVLRSGGYHDLSLTVLAKELGLTRGAIAWYFPTKDDLFAAAAARVFAAALSRPPVRAGYAARIAWAVDRLAELQPLNLAVHDRARHSEAVARLQLAMQEELCARLREVLAPHVGHERLEDVAEVVVVFVQGLLAAPLTGRERQRRLRFLLGELVRGRGS